LYKIFVFPYSKRSLNFELFYFFCINIAAFPLVLGASYLLGELILGRWLPQQLSRALGHGIALTLPVFINFAIHKFFTFRDVLDPPKERKCPT
jgi:hypothetical protein